MSHPIMHNKQLAPSNKMFAYIFQLYSPTLLLSYLQKKNVNFFAVSKDFKNVGSVVTSRNTTYVSHKSSNFYLELMLLIASASHSLHLSKLNYKSFTPNLLCHV